MPYIIRNGKIVKVGAAKRTTKVRRTTSKKMRVYRKRIQRIKEINARRKERIARRKAERRRIDAYHAKQAKAYWTKKSMRRRQARYASRRRMLARHPMDAEASLWAAWR